VALEEKREKEAALTNARKTLTSMNGRGLPGGRRCPCRSRGCGESKGGSRSVERAAIVAEEAATKAWEEAARYKGEAVELDKEKGSLSPTLPPPGAVMLG
jgi:hypothetical protein